MTTRTSAADEPLTVLVADPSPASAAALSELLADHAVSKLEVRVAVDGHHALTQVELRTPDIAILSQNLAYVAPDNIAVQLNSSRRKPLVVYVAADREARAKAQGSGLYDLVLMKPLDVARLIGLIDEGRT